MRNYIRAALAGLVLSAIPIGARAASCITAPAGGTQCFEPMILIDPTTGQPYAASGGGGTGSGGGAVYGTDATGAAPTKPPLFLAGVDASGNIKPFTITAAGLQFFDTTLELGVGSPNDTAASVGGNGSLVAQLRQEVTQVAAVLAQLKTVLAVSGNVTGSQGTPAAVGNAWPTYLTVAGAANAVGNPAFVQLTAGGATIGSIANTAFALNAGSAIVGKVGIDQTTPGTTNRVSIGTDGVITLGNGNAVIGYANISGQYLSTLSTFASGQISAIQIDKHGYLKTAEAGSDDAGAGITPVVIQSGTSAVGKASQGNLYSAYAVNTTATAGYLVLINAAAAPSSGAAITPVDVAALSGAVGATATVNYGAGPPNAYSTGMVALITTSLTTYTPGGNAFVQVRAR